MQVDTKLSKAQISKIIQSGGFLGWNDISLYVPATSQVRPKSITQRRLDGTSPRRLSGMSPRGLIGTS